MGWGWSWEFLAGFERVAQRELMILGNGWVMELGWIWTGQRNWVFGNEMKCDGIF
jgi:hypothetical protein